MFDIDWNKKLDSKLDDAIKELLIDCEYQYTKEDLDLKINDEETLREYITDTENSFGLAHKDLCKMSLSELNLYVMELDRRWSNALSG